MYVVIRMTPWPILISSQAVWCAELNIEYERGSSAPRREGLLWQESAEHWRPAHQRLHHRHGYLLRTGQGGQENDTPRRVGKVSSVHSAV